MTARSIGLFLAKLAVSAGIVFWALHGASLDALWQGLADVDARGVALVVAVLLLLAVAQAVRWHWVSRALGDRLALSEALRLVLLGNFVNQALPSFLAGDLVRALAVKRQGIALKSAAIAILVDRVYALTALLALCTLALPVLIAGYRDNAFFWPALALVAAGWAGLLLMLCAPAVLRPFRRIRAVGFLVELSSALRASALASPLAAPIALVALASQLCIMLCAYLMNWLVGAGIGPGAFLALFPAVFLLSMLPISIAGWGVREGAMLLAFAAIAEGQDAVLLVSLLFGGALFGAGLGGGLVWLAMELVAPGRGARAATPPVPRSPTPSG